ncbi:hypothetical protein [Kitasatospora sp. NPDC059827]|uniref:hypothetical protein n=1 Tax=Kitasatospora sp. NPDC059827 TaxID=3346964 RepID=UPI00364EBFF3
MARYRTYATATAAGVPLPVISKTLRHRTLSTTANIYADHAELGHPVCPAQRPWRQRPRLHRQLPAYHQARKEEPTAPWPMWPGDHRATTN